MLIEIIIIGSSEKSDSISDGWKCSTPITRDHRQQPPGNAGKMKVFNVLLEVWDYGAYRPTATLLYAPTIIDRIATPKFNK